MADDLAKAIVRAARMLWKQEVEVILIIYYHPVERCYDDDQCRFGIKQPSTKGFKSLEEAFNYLALEGYRHEGGIIDLLKGRRLFDSDSIENIDVLTNAEFEANEKAVVEMKKTVILLDHAAN